MSTVVSKKAKKRRSGKKKVGRKSSGTKTGRAEKRRGEVTIDRDSSEERFAAWAQSLANRKQPLALVDLLGSVKQIPLLWGVSAETAVTDDSWTLVQQLWRIPLGKDSHDDEMSAAWVSEWLDAAETREPSIGFALECLGWAHLLPHLARSLPAVNWWELLSQLMAIAAEAGAAPVSEAPCQQQLLGGELPLILAYLFPEIKDCRRLLADATGTVSLGIDELLDGEGMIHADHLAWQRVLLASWTRSLLLAAQLAGKKKRITKDARIQYEWLVRNSLRLTRADGSQTLGRTELTGTELDAYREMMKVALGITQDHEDRALAKAVFRKAKRWPQDLPDDYDLPAEPGCHSEWAEWAVLQPDWAPLSPRLTVAFAHRTLQVELSTINRTLLLGTLDPEIRINGRLLEGQSDWEVVCWVADDDVDFIELEMRLDAHWVIQRQIVMAREDMFLWMADAILGKQAGRIEYRQEFPLASGVKFVAANECQEGSLKAGKRSALMLPVGLPEWRADVRMGSFKMEGDSPVLRQHHDGTALFVPLFVDLHPERRRKRLTWRRLTVAEQLEIVPSDVAVAYRIQVAGEQWVCYRSLSPAANRTFMGQNYSSETLIGRFLEDGTTEDLVEIET